MPSKAKVKPLSGCNGTTGGRELHFYSCALCIQKIFLNGSLSVKICQTHKCLLCSVLWLIHQSLKTFLYWCSLLAKTNTKAVISLSVWLGQVRKLTFNICIRRVPFKQSHPTHFQFRTWDSNELDQCKARQPRLIIWLRCLGTTAQQKFKGKN